MIKKLLLLHLPALLIALFSVALIPNLPDAKVCAQTQWGGCAGAYATCPTGKTQSHCSTASDFNVTVSGTGIAVGQQFRIDIYPADGSVSCSDVTCLTRSTSYTFSWTGSTFTETFNQIGCSTSSCANSYNVNVYMTGSATSGSCSVNPSSAIRSFTIANGVPNSAAFVFTCTPVSTATPTVKPPTATPTKTPPACGVACTIPSDCAAAKDGCTLCGAGGICEAPPPTATLPPGVPTATAAPPTATLPPGVPTATKTPPTATPTKVPPACGTDCVRDSECTGAASRDGCTACLPTGPGGKKVCSKPPACGTPCDRDSDCSVAKDGCVVCLPGGSGGSKVCSKVPPTPTPTPAFNDSMCKCEPPIYGSIILGAPATISARGKVEGADTSVAKITGFKFAFYESANGAATGIRELKTGQTGAKVIENAPSLVRYQSDPDWVLDIDPQLDTSKVYRIKATPICAKKTAFFNTSNSLAKVLAVQDAPKSFLDRIIGFFVGLFQNSRPQQTQTPVATPTLTPDQKASLQLKTIKPATNVDLEPDPEDKQNCSFIRFNF